MRALLLSLLLCLAGGSLTQAQETPAYPGLLLFVSNLEGGEENGYAKQITQSAGTFKCGRDPYVTEVSWKFLGRSPKGDVYEVTKFSPDEKSPAVSRKKVIYDNEITPIWKEADRVVMLKPKDR